MNNEFKEVVLSLPLTEEVFDKLATANNRTALRSSASLTKRQWVSLWDKDLPAELAARMIENDMDREQVEAVLAFEQRGTVLLSLFRRALLDEEQQGRALAAAKGTTFVPLVMQSKSLSPALRLAAAERLVGTDRLEWIAVHHSAYDDDVVFEAFTDAVASKVPLRDLRTLNQTVGKIIASRPGLVHRLASQDIVPHQLRTALASSRHLVEESDQVNLFATMEDSKFAALAFVANPVAHEAPVRALADHEDAEVRSAVRKRLDQKEFDRVSLPYDQVVDPAQLQRLLRRSLPNTYRQEGRPADLAILALNDKISLIDAKKVFDALYAASLDTVSASMLDTALVHLAKRLGVQPPALRIDGGFWDRDGVSYRLFQIPPLVWALPSQDRSWESIDLAALVESYPVDLAERIGGSKLANVVYEDRAGLHLWLVHKLGNIPAHWEMMLNLSKTHLGTLTALITAAQRLVR